MCDQAPLFLAHDASSCPAGAPPPALLRHVLQRLWRYTAPDVVIRRSLNFVWSETRYGYERCLQKRLECMPTAGDLGYIRNRMSHLRRRAAVQGLATMDQIRAVAPGIALEMQTQQAEYQRIVDAARKLARADYWRWPRFREHALCSLREIGDQLIKDGGVALMLAAVYVICSRWPGGQPFLYWSNISFHLDMWRFRTPFAWLWRRLLGWTPGEPTWFVHPAPPAADLALELAPRDWLQAMTVTAQKVVCPIAAHGLWAMLSFAVGAARGRISWADCGRAAWAQCGQAVADVVVKACPAALGRALLGSARWEWAFFATADMVWRALTLPFGVPHPSMVDIRRANTLLHWTRTRTAHVCQDGFESADAQLVLKAIKARLPQVMVTAQLVCNHVPKPDITLVMDNPALQEALRLSQVEWMVLAGYEEQFPADAFHKVCAELGAIPAAGLSYAQLVEFYFRRRPWPLFDQHYRRALSAKPFPRPAGGAGGAVGAAAPAGSLQPPPGFQGGAAGGAAWGGPSHTPSVDADLD